MYIPKNAFYNPNFNPYKVSCEQPLCQDINAYVNCITDILQGRMGCITILLVDEFGQPLDLSRIKYIEIVITNALGYYVGTWTKKDIYVEKDSGDGEDTEPGKFQIFLTGNQTNTVSGPLTAQILVVTDEEKCNNHVIGCLVLANIVKNILNNICINGGSDSGDGEEVPDENWSCDRDKWVVWDD